MTNRLLPTMRLFQRVVTREVGALDNDFLGRGRPLGSSRLLWEMGDGPVEVATLRERLGLDAGYVSRLLRGLESEGLVEVGPSPDDARAKQVTRTAAGELEAATLDVLSDDAVAALAADLTDAEAEELERAARHVTRVFARRHLRIEIEDPESRDVIWCRDQYFAELQATFDHGYDPARALPAAAPEFTPPRGALLVARLHGQPVGCGGVKLPPGEPALLKRMWVAPAARGLGLAGMILDRLEALARESGARAVRLDTNSKLGAAAELYRSRGYRQVPDFNGEPHADRWYRKDFEPVARPHGAVPGVGAAG